MNSKLRTSFNKISVMGGTKRKRASLFLSLILIICASFFGSGAIGRYINNPEIATASNAPANTSLSVTFLDVGQGNCIIAESQGHYILIDGGNAAHSSFLVSYIKDLGMRTFDYIVISHYDSDHLSGIVGVLNNFNADHVISPDYEADTRTYNSFVSIMSKKNYNAIHPSVGDEFEFGDAGFKIVSPVKYDYEDENNNSVGIKLTDGFNSFLILGDAEFKSEYDMIGRNIDLTCDVYMVSHHGSSNASSDRLLDAAHPSTAIISVGENDYGHPDNKTLDRLFDHSINVLRTDLNGTIIAYSGHDFLKWNVNFDTKSVRQSDANSTDNSSDISYIGNKNSLKFHLPSCTSLPASYNQVFFDSRDDAENAGYSPCGLCNP